MHFQKIISGFFVALVMSVTGAKLHMTKHMDCFREIYSAFSRVVYMYRTFLVEWITYENVLPFFFLSHFFVHLDFHAELIHDDGGHEYWIPFEKLRQHFVPYILRIYDNRLQRAATILWKYGKYYMRDNCSLVRECLQRDFPFHQSFILYQWWKVMFPINIWVS